jgi:signal transduction histidine kinase
MRPDGLWRAHSHVLTRNREEDAPMLNETGLSSLHRGLGRIILDHMQIGVIFADAKDVVRYANGVAGAMLNVRIDEILGQDILSLQPECLRAAIDEAINSFREDAHAAPVTFHSSLCTRGLLLRCAPAVGPDSCYEGIVVNLVDITENIRELEQRFEAQKAETIRSLTGGIAHGFNNLMATVLGLASHLKARRSKDHPDHGSLIQIEEAAATAGRLAHQLLAFVRGGKFLARTARCADLMTLVRSQIQTFLPPTVLLDYRIPTDLWPLDCDVVEIEQVIVAVCRNAVEAMPTGGRLAVHGRNVVIDEPPENTRPLLTRGEYVCITVEDTGCGMDPKTVERLFEPFFTTKPNGFGLSLAAAYSVVRSHGGAIATRSERGRGSTFEIWLPRATSAEEP